MAGLGETCSHIAALLYWLKTAVRIQLDTICISQPNTWLSQSMPSACVEVPYVTLEALEELATSRKQATTSTSAELYAETKKLQPGEMELQPGEMELQKVFANLSTATDRKPAILSVIPPYSDAFIKSSEHFPPLLSELYNPDNLSMDYCQLLKILNLSANKVQPMHRLVT